MDEEISALEAKKAKYELTAKKGDIIIKFYDYAYPFPVIIAKSKDWVKNIEFYNKTMEESLKKTNVKSEDPCEAEGCCDVCCPA